MPIKSNTVLWVLARWKPYWSTFCIPCKVGSWTGPQRYRHSVKGASPWSASPTGAAVQRRQRTIGASGSVKQFLTNIFVTLTQSARRARITDSSCKKVLSIRMISLLFVVLLRSISAMQSTLQAQITVLAVVIKHCNQNFKRYWAAIQR